MHDAAAPTTDLTSRPSALARPACLAVYVLAVGTFLMLTTEFIVAGLLPEIAVDLHVTSPAPACSSPSSRSG